MGSDDDGRQRDEAFATLLRSGDVAAFGLLFDSWADPVYDRISNRWFTTADASKIEVGAFVATHRRVAQQGATDPFRVLVLRATSQAMAAADGQQVDLRMPVGPYAEDRLTRAAEARSLAADPAVAGLLWEAADVLGPQVRDVLDLHFRHHLTADEVATVMQESPASIEAILGKVEAGYGAVVRARIMWRQGTPNHDVLAAAVAGPDGFDTAVVKLVADHLRTCDPCRAASQVPVPPISAFAAIPIAIAPPGFKEGVVEALTVAGLPMDSSASSVAARRRSPSLADEAVAPVVAAGATAPLLAAAPGTEGRAAVVPPLDEHDRVMAVRDSTGEAPTGRRARSKARARDGKAAETGLAVGLAAFAGPAAGAAAEADPTYGTAPGETGGSSGSRDGTGSGGGSRRTWLVAAVAAVAVVVVLAVVVLGGSSSKHHDTKLATADDRSTSTEVTTTVTTPGAPTTVTTASATPTTTAAPGASTTSTTAKATTTTVKAKSSGGGAPTTTVSPFFPGLDRTFAFNASTVNTPKGFWLTSSLDAPQLSWSVTANTSISVVVSGPGFSSTQSSGTSSDLCPGTLTGDTCTVSPGSYAYTLTVSDSHGHSIPETLTLTVNGPTATTTSTLGP